MPPRTASPEGATLARSPSSPISPPSRSSITSQTPQPSSSARSTAPSSPTSPPATATPHSKRNNARSGANGSRDVGVSSSSMGGDGVASPPVPLRLNNEEGMGAEENSGGGGRGQAGGKALSERRKKTTLSKADLVKMTVGIAGAQLAWSVELAYGTPYLLSLGLTKQGTSLVWMAGPLSGLVVQPIVGALSDASPSRYRRRKYIALSALIIILSTLVVAFAVPLGAFVSSLLPSSLGGGGGEMQGKVAIGLGVVGFYALDFALNGLAASLKNLVLDLSPPGTHSTANAYLGVQANLANILGYLLGYADLSHSPLLSWIGGGQFRKLALVSCAVMAATVGVTCVTQQEEARVVEEGQSEGKGGALGKLKSVVSEIWRNVRELPTPIRRVCYVQFFNMTAWFPFMFYSTTYISETLYASQPPSSPSHPIPPPSSDDATRLGSLALLFYAIVSLIASAFVPYLTTLGTHYPSLPRRVGPAGRILLSKITPRNCWTFGLLWYAGLMVSTFWVKGVWGSVAVVALAGVAAAVNGWALSALVMEAIHDLDAAYDAPTDSTDAAPPAAASSSSADASTASAGRDGQARATERTPVLCKTRAIGKAGGGTGKRKRVSGGTLLGIHNLAVVLPQFFIAGIAALFFHFSSALPPSDPSFSPSFTIDAFSSSSSTGAGAETLQTNDVVWVLRFGGLFALLGAVVSQSRRWGLLETGSERRYRWWVLEGWREGEEGGVGGLSGSEV